MTMPLNAIELLAASARLVRATGQKDLKTVASPCRAVCQMDAATGLCQGCLRTLNEVAQWGAADAAYKRAVWARIEERIAHDPHERPI